MGSALPELHRYGIAAIVNTAALPLPGPPPPSPSPLGRGSWAPSWAPHLPVPRGTPRTVTLPPTRSAGYYAGQLLISALRDLNGTPYPICAHCTLCGPVVCTRDTVL
jgi:hypothetical protein